MEYKRYSNDRTRQSGYIIGDSYGYINRADGLTGQEILIQNSRLQYQSINEYVDRDNDSFKKQRYVNCMNELADNKWLIHAYHILNGCSLHECDNTYTEMS